MKLNEIANNPGAHKHKHKVGRGSSSGLGKTSGRGVKGAKARTGNAVYGFEGGQMPLHMRMPKRGFNNIFGTDFSEVNLKSLQKAIDNKKIIVWGFSTGGYYALRVAHTHHDRLFASISLGGGCHHVSHQWKSIQVRLG